MSYGAAPWLAALVASLSLHGVAVALLAPGEVTIEVAPGAGGRTTIEGSLAGALGAASHGGGAEVLTPVAAPAAALEPVGHEGTALPATRHARPAEAVGPTAVARVEALAEARPVAPRAVAAVAPTSVAAPGLGSAPASPRPTQRAAAVEPGTGATAASEDRGEPGGSAAPAHGRAGAEASGTGSGAPAAGNGAAARDADFAVYLGTVMSSLLRHKRYPAAARRNGLEGTAVVAFTIRRDGTVADIRVSQGSGHAILDREVEALVSRSAPFGPFPAGQARASISVSVPISFEVR